MFLSKKTILSSINDVNYKHCTSDYIVPRFSFHSNHCTLLDGASEKSSVTCKYSKPFKYKEYASTRQ